MNKTLFIIYISLLFLSCKSEKNERQKIEDNSRIEKVEITTKTEQKKLTSSQNGKEQTYKKTEKKDAIVIVEKKSDYSEKFISGLRELYGFGDFKLSNNYLILNKNDTIEFPNEPKINKKVVLKAKQEELEIILTLKRKNQVQIEYEIGMYGFSKNDFISKGIAEINSSFFLGSETDTNDLNGIGYLSTEFSDNKGECYTNIRLGTEENAKNLLGKITKNCNGEIVDINLNNFPTLREK